MQKTVTIALFLLIALTQAQSQNVGIGTINPLATLSVGNTSQFMVNSTGNIIRINNIPYSFPNAQGTNQYLKNDGSGNLSWAPVARPVVRIFTVINSGSSNWAIDSPADYGSANNLDPILFLHRGLTYQFSISASGHPFRIGTEIGGDPYLTGITNNSIETGILTFTVPMDAPTVLYYFCLSHGSMNGTITIQ